MAQSLKRVLIVEDDLSLRPFWENFFENNVITSPVIGIKLPAYSNA